MKFALNRRNAIRLAAAATVTGMLSPMAGARDKTLRVLILGGTGFIGPHFVNVLRSGGHTLTLFNRGRRNPGLFKNIETLIGDRDQQIDALKNRDWDAVIDDSGYLPTQVQLTVDLLKGRVPHYIYVSSISAYGDLSKPNIDEDAPLAQLSDPAVNKVTAETFGGLKALCEGVVQMSYGKQCAVIRPSYIVGPGDTTDRFTYWPVRVARGGDMLAPGSSSDPIQFIDARDLADFMRLCVEKHLNGIYNLCNPPRKVSMGKLLDTSKKVSKSDARFHWADATFLTEHKIIDSGEIPIWSSPTGASAGAALISSSRAVAQGLRFRSLETTVSDTLQWQRQRPLEQQQKLRAGLTAERELELLRQLG